MSKKDTRKPSGAREPWEQSIYDTDKNIGASRSEKRQHKKGNTVFLTILVILLLLIIALPVGTYLYVMRDKPNDNKNASQPSSSVVVQSSSKNSSTQPSSSTSTESSTSSSSEDAQSNSVPQETTPTSEAAVYTEVLSGEGPNQVATRNGITTDELLQLNGLSLDSVLQPGQSLRVK